MSHLRHRVTPPRPAQSGSPRRRPALCWPVTARTCCRRRRRRPAPPLRRPAGPLLRADAVGRRGPGLVAGMPQLGRGHLRGRRASTRCSRSCRRHRAERAAERLRDAAAPTRARSGATAPAWRSTPPSWSSATSCCSRPAIGSPPTPRARRRTALLVDTSMLTGESVPAARGRRPALRGHVRRRGRGRGGRRRRPALRPGWRASPGSTRSSATRREPADARSSTAWSGRSRLIAVGVGVALLRLALLVGTPPSDGFSSPSA